MENKIINKDMITRLKGVYQTKYGYEMDEWTVVIMYELKERFDGFIRVLDNSVEETLDGVDQIKDKIKPVHFNDPKEAFRYGLGKSLGLSGPICLAVCFIASLIFWVITTNKQYEEKVAVIESSENIQNFAALADSGKIITDSGQRFLVLKHRPKKGKAKIGRDYEYKTKLNEVWVPLGQ